MSDQSSSSSDGLDFPLYYAVVLGLLFGWICCCCYSTRGCTDCSYNGRDRRDPLEDDPVWGVAARATQASDRRLALELQAREIADQQQQSLTPEQQEAERRHREERVKSRTDFINTHLPTFIYNSNSSSEQQRQPNNQAEDLEAPVNDDDDDNDNLNNDCSSDNNDDDDSAKQGPTCAICMERFQTGDRMTKSDLGKCRHEFHEKCLIDWLIRKSECPICRNTFLKADRDREERKRRQEEQERQEQEQQQQQSEDTEAAPESPQDPERGETGAAATPTLSTQDGAESRAEE